MTGRGLRLLAGGLVALAASAGAARAGAEIEVRAATTEYRFLDLSYSFESGFVLSALYAGDPETNEMHGGAGYAFGSGKRGSMTPIVYVVRGTPLDERGSMVGLEGRLALGAWRIRGFGGRFFATGGEMPDYSFIDTLDVTGAVGSWEIGVSSDAYWIEEESGWRAGPTLMRNDDLGTWGASCRFGHGTEFRITRVLTF